MGKKPKELSDQELTFLNEYMYDFNAMNAAIRAGYSSATARYASKWINENDPRKPTLRARLDEMIAERSRRTGVTADRVVRELARIAFVNPTDLIETKDATIKSDATDNDRAAIQSVRVKTIPTSDGTGIEREVKLYDKQKALETLAKHLGMFNGSGQDVKGLLDGIIKAVQGVE